MRPLLRRSTDRELANLGQYGDAITYELIPYIEKKYRALGAGGRASCTAVDRRVGGHGGPDLLPEEYNGAWIASPDPSIPRYT